MTARKINENVHQVESPAYLTSEEVQTLNSLLKQEQEVKLQMQFAQQAVEIINLRLDNFKLAVSRKYDLQDNDSFDSSTGLITKAK